MKLSVWQQFSSNHSAAFSIVAKFESAEKAKAVAAQVTEMMLEVYRWKEYGLEDWDGNPSQFIHKFEQGMAFGTSWMLSEGHIRRALQVIENTIFVTDAPGYSNFDGSDTTFIGLFEKLGGEVMASREVSSEDVTFDLIGEAQDENAAQAIMEHIIENKSYNGTIEYLYDLNTDTGFHAAAKAVRREGKRLFFEDIYASAYGFDTLSSWYTFAKAYEMDNIRILFHAKPSMKSLEINLNVKYKQLLWQRFENWADTVEAPHFAVAEFESQAIAEKVARNLREILLGIQNWSKQNPVESFRVWEAFWEQLSPVEESLKRLYSLDWSMSVIEWMHYSKQSADSIVVQLDKRIFLANAVNSWVGVNPFDAILGKLRALHIQHFSRTLPRFDFEISVPNRMDLQGLWWVIEGAVREKDYLWLPFYRDYQNPEQWQDDIEFLRLQDEAAKNYQDSLQGYGDVYNDLKIEYRLTEFLQKVYTIPDLFDDNTLRLKRIVRDCEFSYQSISVREDKLFIERGEFAKAASFLGLEAFVKWLQSKGCELKLTVRKS